MLKTFLIGILLGIAATAGALYALPVVDQYREASMLSVATNGGTRESFHINIPMDRIMVGAPNQAQPLPEGMRWPDDELLAGVRSEVYKIRNARDAVVGVAARTTSEDLDAGVIEWVIHLPARGSLFYSMNPAPQEGGYRAGTMRAGSREFSVLRGQLTEHWVADTSGEEDAPTGRLELEASYIGELEPEPVE